MPASRPWYEPYEHAWQERVSRIWVGIDSGEGHHHGLEMDATPDSKTLLSRRVANDEPELLKLIGDVLDLADGRQVIWAIDMTGGEPALLLALLVSHGQEVLYISGRLVNRASDGYRGEGKTDARDAYVIVQGHLRKFRSTKAESRPPASLKPMKPQVTDASWHLEISESLKTLRFGA